MKISVLYYLYKLNFINTNDKMEKRLQLIRRTRNHQTSEDKNTQDSKTVQWLGLNLDRVHAKTLKSELKSDFYGLWCVCRVKKNI